MLSRFAIAVVFAGLFSIQASSAQEIISDVVFTNAAINDGYGGWAECGVDGQVYRHPIGGFRSIMRVSPDGSTLMFALPDDAWPAAIAPSGKGLNILASRASRAEGRFYEMYHFDSQANLLARNPVHLTFSPQQMAVTSSGKTIVVGHHPDDMSQRDDWKYGGAVLDSDDQLTRGFDLPLPPGGGGWTFQGLQMAAGDGVAYAMLHSNTPSQTAIATISEAGNDILKIKVIPVLEDTDQRHHNTWLFGPGVAVEMYHVVGQRPRVFFGFDEYDLSSGERIATKNTLGGGFQPGCYLGDRFSMLAHSAHVDPARGLAPETLRLVTSKLQVSATSGEVP
jgi:hypothetical protein